MSRCRLLILTAVLPEARALARAFRFPSQFTGPLQTHGEIAVGLVGIRARLLPQLAARVEPQAIVMTGLAGALRPGLQIGDVVVDDSSTVLPAGFMENVKIHRGKLHTATHITATAREKADLYRATSALAVDMETAVAHAFAHERGIPFVALRAISDPAEEPLDPALLHLVDDLGKPRMIRVLRLLARHPTRLAALLRIKRATDLALRRLAAVLEQLAASGWPALPTNGRSPAPTSART